MFPIRKEMHPMSPTQIFTPHCFNFIFHMDRDVPHVCFFLSGFMLPAILHISDECSSKMPTIIYTSVD